MTPLRATFVIEDERARRGFLAWARRAIPAGRALVQVRDLQGRRRAFRTEPTAPGAELVGVEAPMLLRGGLTQVTRYYCVPDDDLRADEIHYDRLDETHRYDVELRVACRGRASARVSA